LTVATLALGPTGIMVSPLTLGTAALAKASEPRQVVAAAMSGGVRAIELDAGDAAAIAVLAGVSDLRDMAVLVRIRPQVPLDLPSPHLSVADVYSARSLRDQTESLLRTLGIKRLDLLQLHAWSAEWLDEGDWRQEAERLRSEGKIGGIGVSLFDGDVDAAIGAVDARAVDAVEVMFNLFDTAAATGLLPTCRERGVGVIARSPFYYGLLAGPVDRATGFAQNDWRREFFFDEHLQEASDRAARVQAALEPGETLAQVALRFTLSHPAVTTVATGLTSVAQVEHALAAIALGPLPPDRLRSLFAQRWLC